jgi:GxxExxY protein
VDVGVQRLDLIAAGEIILDLKAVKAFDDVHFAQLRSYLKATGLRVGLLLNFNAPTLVIKRGSLIGPVSRFRTFVFRD